MSQDGDKKIPQDATPLSRTFCFSFSFFNRARGAPPKNWKDENKSLGSFNTVEGFWSYYRHMVRPDKLPLGCDINLFQENIEPMWEDEANRGGGRFILRIKPNYANKFWEDLLIGYIGEQCEENDEICGMVLSIKNSEILISLWTKQIHEKVRGLIKEWIRTTLGLSEKAEIEYRPHPRKEEPGAQSQQKFHKRIERNEEFKPRQITQDKN